MLAETAMNRVCNAQHNGSTEGAQQLLVLEQGSRGNQAAPAQAEVRWARGASGANAAAVRRLAQRAD